jgi:5-hydroxyisourate hydrolase-like protein (transthyretin family)
VDAAGALRVMSEFQAYSIVGGRGMGESNIAREIEARRRNRMRLTHAALHRELAALSSARARKSLLLVTQGFIQDSGPELRETARIAHQANVAIYFLDVRGLMTTPGSTADVAGSPDPSRVAASILEQDVHDTAGSQDLAADTGGLSIRSSNDLSGGMDRIATESRVFYLLGFHPASGKPGEWRELKVTVRRPGLTVRARRGYSWQPPSDRAPAPGAFVPLRLASYVRDPVDPDRTRLTVAIEIHVGSLAPVEGASQLTLRLEAFPRDDPSRTYSRDLELPRDDDGIESEGWQSVRLEVALPPDVYRVRAEVADPSTNRRGVAEQRVAVPGLGTFRISTPVLSDLPVTGANPPVPVPVARRTFNATAGRPLLYAFAVLGAAKDPATDGSDVRMEMAVKDRSGRRLVEATDAVVAPSSDGRLEQVVSLPIAQMPSGEYELHLTVRDHIAGKIVERKETFVVEAATVQLEPVDLDVGPILGRAGQYVVAYQAAFSDLVADEDYQQDWDSGNKQRRRRSRADMVFVSLPGAIPWAVFRDVYEVDGKKVRGREARLERLFRRPPDGAAAAAARAKKIVDESARFNLGPVRRTVNIPTLALLVLHPDNQRRFAFGRKETTSIGGTEAVQIDFTETFRPTFTRGRDGDLVASGSVWVDAEAGTVLKTEIAYSPAVWGRSRGTSIVTDYEREPRLQVVVPVQMTETYRWSGGAITAVARYSGYRRFEVTTDEKYIAPPEERP